jgi:hypothetical protein
LFEKSCAPVIDVTVPAALHVGVEVEAFAARKQIYDPCWPPEKRTFPATASVVGVAVTDVDAVTRVINWLSTSLLALLFAALQ